MLFDKLGINSKFSLMIDKTTFDKDGKKSRIEIANLDSWIKFGDGVCMISPSVGSISSHILMQHFSFSFSFSPFSDYFLLHEFHRLVQQCCVTRSNFRKQLPLNSTRINIVFTGLFGSGLLLITLVNHQQKVCLI